MIVHILSNTNVQTSLFFILIQVWHYQSLNHQKEKHHIVCCRGAGFEYCLFSSRSLGKMNPFWRAYFQMGVSKNRGTPKSSNWKRVFHYKPSILGYPYSWKHPDGLVQPPTIVAWTCDFSETRLSPAKTKNNRTPGAGTSLSCSESNCSNSVETEKSRDL